MPVEIHGYCDGACKKNPGIGGWGCFYSISSTPYMKWCFSGGKDETTNNEMELSAMKKLLKEMDVTCSTIENLGNEGGESVLKIHSDSNYVLKGIVHDGQGILSSSLLHPSSQMGWIRGWKRNGWKTSAGTGVKNVELWKDIELLIELHLSKGRVLEFIWVKGHSGNDGNELADTLANIYCLQTKH